MGFGVRLPGGFRVGFNGKGRVSLGASMGPFSVSTSGGGTRRVPLERKPREYPGAVEQYVAQAEGNGWVVTGRDATTVFMRHGSSRLRIDRVRPGIVTVQRMASTMTNLLLVVIVMAPALACLAYLRL